MERIKKFFDLENEEKIKCLHKEYRNLTEKALELASEGDYVDNETALRNRDRIFFENLLKAFKLREKELGLTFTPNEKNYIIDKIVKIVNENYDTKD